MNKADTGIPLHPAPEDTDLSTSKGMILNNRLHIKQQNKSPQSAKPKQHNASFLFTMD